MSLSIYDRKRLISSMLHATLSVRICIWVLDEGLLGFRPIILTNVNLTEKHCPLDNFWNVLRSIHVDVPELENWSRSSKSSPIFDTGRL